MSDTDSVDTPQRLADPTRGGDGTFARSLDTAERDAEAARLRSRSMSYRAIAKELGVDVHTAHDMVKRAMAAVVREDAQAVIDMELAKLDRAEAAVLAVMEATHYTVSNGRLIEIDGVPLADDAPVLNAADRLVRISESRRKLLGADAAQKIDTNSAVKFTYEGVNVSDV